MEGLPLKPGEAPGCNWIIEAYTHQGLPCHNAVVMQQWYTSLAIIPLIIAALGCFLMGYRRRFQWVGLWNGSGWDIRPAPMDWLVTWWIGFLVARSFSSLLILANLDMQTWGWLVELGAESTNVLLSIGVAGYIVGIMHAIPVTYKNSKEKMAKKAAAAAASKAVVVSSTGGAATPAAPVTPSEPLPDTDVWLPNTKQINCLFLYLLLWPFCTSIPTCLTISAVRNAGNYHMSITLRSLQNFFWVSFIYQIAASCAYFGYKLVLILESNLKQAALKKTAMTSLQIQTFKRLQLTMWTIVGSATSSTQAFILSGICIDYVQQAQPGNPVIFALNQFMMFAHMYFPVPAVNMALLATAHGVYFHWKGILPKAETEVGSTGSAQPRSGESKTVSSVRSNVPMIKSAPLGPNRV